MSYIPEVIMRFGKDAVPEFLQHISSDYKSSARKWGLKRSSSSEPVEEYLKYEDIKFPLLKKIFGKG